MLTCDLSKTPHISQESYKLLQTAGVLLTGPGDFGAGSQKDDGPKLPPAACQQRSGAADPAGCLPRPPKSTESMGVGSGGEGLLGPCCINKHEHKHKQRRKHERKHQHVIH